MQNGQAYHIPVLAGPALEWLRVQPEGTYVDATAGAGGHGVLIAEQLQGGRLIALDRDPVAVRLASKRLDSFPCAAVYHGNYGTMAGVLAELAVTGVDGILIDAGLSSMQVDNGSRGFSFQSDGPLDMRMDSSQGPTAIDYLAGVSEPELTAVLRDYGDVGPARRIARTVIERRNAGRLQSTVDLAAAVASALDFVQGVPAEVRTVFQAVRMAVNEELRWLERGIEEAIGLLRPGGRLVVISFHSGEDRTVKRAFREASRRKRLLFPDGRVKQVLPPRVRVLTASPVAPDDTEIASNPRSKSAKLRAVERLKEGPGGRTEEGRGR